MLCRPMKIIKSCQVHDNSKPGKRKKAVEASKKALKEARRPSPPSRSPGLHRLAGRQPASRTATESNDEGAAHAMDEETTELYNDWAPGLLQELNKKN
jgi:hypothetical protein